ncbi:MAG: glycerol-3-phosphate dehydrogenase [Candidatus Omnitrophica bacterium]|nr:glycerol-3-phosphate dehydrogenase [Candidatus Omnitrophota bacterium]
MKRNPKQLTIGEYDLLVIGGGINGAAVANMAAQNGLKVALVDQGDFASGTSSKSTKLIHGGLRYLKNLEWGLVKSSLQERAIQLQKAPHLVKPIRFIMPVYKTDPKPLWYYRAGMWLYDLLAGKNGICKHKVLSADDVKRAVPKLDEEGLIGGIAYYDAQMDDTRLCLANIRQAEKHGAHVANYLEVRSFMKENGRAVGVKVFDRRSQEFLTIRAQQIVAAVGPWSNILAVKENRQSVAKVRLTKGVHIVYKGELTKQAVVMPTHSDRRILFFIPFHGNTLIGTTDTDYDDQPENVQVKKEDVEYIFSEAARIFKEHQFSQEKIITSFAGLRPLVQSTGKPSAVSRDHTIEQSYSKVIYVYGGKYTTYRKIAEDVMVVLSAKKNMDTMENFQVYGGGRIKEGVETAVREFGLPRETIEYLMDMYGTAYREVLSYLKNDKKNMEPICDCSLTIKAQILYGLEKEMAVTEEDLVSRRLMLQWNECKSQNCRKAIHQMMSEIKK